MQNLEQREQETFDTVVAGLRAQGGPCAVMRDIVDEGTGEVTERRPMCCYRESGGRKCGLGFLIPDDKYEQRMEGMLLYEVMEIAGIQIGESPDFFADLRYIHDQPFLQTPLRPGVMIPDEHWRDGLEERIRKCARRWELVYTPPTA